METVAVILTARCTAIGASGIALAEKPTTDPDPSGLRAGAIVPGDPADAADITILQTLLHDMQRSKARRDRTALCKGDGRDMILTVEGLDHDPETSEVRIRRADRLVCAPRRGAH